MKQDEASRLFPVGSRVRSSYVATWIGEGHVTGYEDMGGGNVYILVEWRPITQAIIDRLAGRPEPYAPAVPFKFHANDLTLISPED